MLLDEPLILQQLDNISVSKNRSVEGAGEGSRPSALEITVTVNRDKGGITSESADRI